VKLLSQIASRFSRPFTAWAGRLCLLLAVFAAAPAAQAAGHPTGPQSETRSLFDSLSVHHGGREGFVLPRDGIAPQPAIASRKKALKLPIDIVTDNADLPVATNPATAARFAHAIDQNVYAHQAPPQHPWQSRAPPGVN
jgi:hypothetical protein